MNDSRITYPWYGLVNGDELEQGDILESCPVFSPPSNLTRNSLEIEELEFIWEERDVIIMSQSCDLVKGREKLKDVLFCTVWSHSELETLPETAFSAKGDWEQTRKGQRPAFHVLNECTLPNAERDFSIVDFRRTYALPLNFTREFALRVPNRIRLLPPYREHLSQAFARFFMRVGLPSDIPPFR